MGRNHFDKFAESCARIPRILHLEFGVLASERFYLSPSSPGINKADASRFGVLLKGGDRSAAIENNDQLVSIREPLIFLQRGTVETKLSSNL